MEQINNPYLKQVRNHPLFSGATAAEFGDLIKDCTWKNYQKAERILYSHSPRDGFLLMLKGTTEVYVSFHDTHKDNEVLEVLQQGEIIGFSSLADFLGEPTVQDNPYTVEVQAVEDAECIHIPSDVLQSVWHREEVRDYVLRQVAVRLRDIYSSLAEQVHLANQWGESAPFIQRVQDIMNSPISAVTEDTPIYEVADKMVNENASSIIVEKENGDLAGIITEKDLVERVIASRKTGTEHAADIMSKHPYVITTQAYYYEAMSSFLMNGVKHLPVADDYTEKRIVGIITLADLLKKQNRGKFDILKEIESSTKENLPDVKNAIYDVLANLIQDAIPALHTTEIVTKLYDRLVRHCVQKAQQEIEKKYGEPPAPFAFYLMGSGGRGEQFMLTDQDHFLVYTEMEDETKKETVDTYFRALGNEIVIWMERAGYKRCDGNMMASEASWRGTVTDWNNRLRTWGLRATNENILLGHNFLAFRFLYGDESLHEHFKSTVREQFERSRIFLYRAAEQERNHPVPILDHPIRALFRVKKDNIDIKKHALFPFHHSLQILSAHHGIFGETPLDTINALQEKGVMEATYVDELRFAYEVVVKIRMEQSWNRYKRKESNGSEIVFTQMKSRDKEALITALKTIRSLQNKVLTTFAMK
ncbi:cyclic nucleotide-binding/CBS domain-containing protein [Salibacterium salarium]|uniref:Cyclic nucleotide-binding/CBS domain-containing protein n=1 Tax=Salibacterium salarium TaxID=284579 RepID=A0A428MU72_9BACI|nr:DUF294 nucleotidyltransferase-like domain-containing protein [Salibacterium salarium]RSL29680.1 cyclic nucleotide-binding/CBS domain-containing protein [Salibacterium salarium]